MKFNITVDVDWIDEEGSIDEKIQKQISNYIYGEISKKNEGKIIKPKQFDIVQFANDLMANAKPLKIKKEVKNERSNYKESE